MTIKRQGTWQETGEVGEEGNPDSLLGATLPPLHPGGRVEAAELESQRRTAKPGSILPV